METHNLIGENREASPTIPSTLKSEVRNRFLRSRISSRRTRNRLVQKHGLCNISLVNVPKQHRKYFRDIFTTVIEIKWRWCLIFIFMLFFLSWSLFTSVYYIQALYHGDLGVTGKDPQWKPCIENCHDLLNLFLFAFTTQTTIGYGYRYPTDACPLVVVTMCIQFMFGVMCQTLMAGVIFAKLARPIKRAATILFSKNCVICVRDGKLCLQFRVGDMRKSLLAEAHVRLQMIKKCFTLEGEILPFHQFDMDVGYDSGLDRVFVIWPITICHEINEDSPLYEVSKENLVTSRFEIIALLEGVVESVGSTTQARTSYLPAEILWGKRFARLVTYQRDNGQYKIDLAKFHDVRDVHTPNCSAKELEQMQEDDEESKCFSTTPQIAVQFSSKEPSVIEMEIDRSSIQKNFAPTHVNIESDVEDIYDNSHENTTLIIPGLTKKLSSLSITDSKVRRKQSNQVRRGPDLF